LYATEDDNLLMDIFYINIYSFSHRRANTSPLFQTEREVCFIKGYYLNFCSEVYFTSAPTSTAAITSTGNNTMSTLRLFPLPSTVVLSSMG